MTSWFPISPFLQYILNNKFISLILSAYYKSKGGQEGTARKHLLYPMVPFNLWSWISFWISLSVSVPAYPEETMKGPNEVRIQETSIPWKIIRCSTNTVRNYPGKIWGHVWCQCVLDQSPADCGGPSLLALIHALQRHQCRGEAATMSYAMGMYMLYSYL